MGSLLAKLWSKLFNYAEFKVLVVGLNSAGKTTTLYKLLLNEVVVTAPTIGSNVEEVVYKNLKFLMWDLGGQEAARQAWHTYFINTHALILVIDSTDSERLPLVKQELLKMLMHEDLKNAILLVFANKQDLKGALTSEEISEALSLHSIKGHDWHIQSCCALTGEGLYPGMDWIAQHVKRS